MAPLACVLGNTDLVRPLGMAGIRCAAVTRPDRPQAYSRFVAERIEWADNWRQHERMTENLLAFAERQPEPPPLFFQHDGDLVYVSRNRDALEGRFRFTVADRELVEQLVDKTRFCELAERVGLPVPRSVVLRPAAEPGLPDLALDFPIVVKPLTRRDVVWRPLAGHSKAIELGSRGELEAFWPRLVEAGVELVAQELVAGGEERIESYHVYVDLRGEIAGEFTGRKVRTLPRRFGDTTALETTEAGDVRELGAECVRRLGLRGAAKLDFKRAPSGRLHLLEVNPRFNLWHHVGAVAGVNLPAIAYADLVGLPRPVARAARPGVRWSVPWHDLAARREWDLSLARWVRWQLRCDAYEVLALDDPLPFLRGIVERRVRGRLRR